ncbi:MAG TPA: AraC family transcriptional regulator [Steroidobacteraceae bacterium]|nr:AraC family transcriptional regulator [Steroidobacteraceae bacterium]
MINFAHIANGRENWDAGHTISRHMHGRPYVAIVLSGSYEECGSRGRFQVGPGDALLHTPFDVHLDRFRHRGAQILNLGAAESFGFSLGRVGDPDAIARVAERDPTEACAHLCEQLREAEPTTPDWPDILARDLLHDPSRSLGGWARAHGIAAETLSRGFGKVFGVTPAAFRLEVRARRAFALISESDAPLVSIALGTGFADQAHMSRATRALTGSSPSAWRRSNQFKTGETQAG